MIDLSDGFIFDLQRFSSLTFDNVSYSSIGASVTNGSGNSGAYYWAGASLVQFSTETGYSYSAVLGGSGNTVDSTLTGSGEYYNVDNVTGLTLTGGGDSYKFSNIDSTQSFSIFGLSNNTVEGLHFSGTGSTVPSLEFSGATGAGDYLSIAGGSLADIALGTSGAAFTVNENNSSITWTINSVSLALDSNFTFKVDGTDKTLEILSNADNDTVTFQYVDAVDKIFGLSSHTIAGLSTNPNTNEFYAVPELVFTGATSNAYDYISIAHGYVNNIALSTINASLSVVDSTSGIGLYLNGYSIDLDQGFNYQVKGESSRIITLNDPAAGGYSAVIKSVGGASRIYMGAGYSLFTIGEASDD